MRHGVAALTRRTCATAQTTSRLLLHLEWWRGYDHFVRPHPGLRVALTQPRLRGGHHLPQRYWAQTPAMAAGLTSYRWTAVILLVYPYVPTP